MKLRNIAFGLAAIGLVACSGESTAPIQQAEAQPPAGHAQTAKVANFKLTDQKGVTHELYSKTDAKALVFVMQGVGCPIVQQLTPDLKLVQAEYEAKGVEFLMINSNSHDKPEMIAAEAEKFGLELPILKDPTQAVGKQLNAVRTAEVFVVEPKTWKVLYHGPLSDRLTYGRAKAKADNEYTKQVLDAVLGGKPVPEIHAMADGCIINYVNT
jgi:peroxiredoxin